MVAAVVVLWGSEVVIVSEVVDVVDAVLDVGSVVLSVAVVESSVVFVSASVVLSAVSESIVSVGSLFAVLVLEPPCFSPSSSRSSWKPSSSSSPPLSDLLCMLLPSNTTPHRPFFSLSPSFSAIPVCCDMGRAESQDTWTPSCWL